MHSSEEEYRAAPESSVGHFHEKLLLLRNRMQTETGKTIARARHDYMVGILAEFMDEWEGKDIEGIIINSPHFNGQCLTCVRVLLSCVAQTKAPSACNGFELQIAHGCRLVSGRNEQRRQLRLSPLPAAMIQNPSKPCSGGRRNPQRIHVESLWRRHPSSFDSQRKQLLNCYRCVSFTLLIRPMRNGRFVSCEDSQNAAAFVSGKSMIYLWVREFYLGYFGR
jgi:hypothetical protein